MQPIKLGSLIIRGSQVGAKLLIDMIMIDINIIIVIRNPNRRAEFKGDIQEIEHENRKKTAQEHGNRTKYPQEEREREVESP